MRPALGTVLFDGDMWQVGIEDDPATVDLALDAAGNPRAACFVAAGPNGGDVRFRFIVTLGEVQPGRSEWMLTCDGRVIADVGRIFAEARMLEMKGDRLSLWGEEGHVWDVVREEGG